jgi:hypothetical protein
MTGEVVKKSHDFIFNLCSSGASAASEHVQLCFYKPLNDRNRALCGFGVERVFCLGVPSIQRGVERQGDAPGLFSVATGELAHVGKLARAPVHDRIEEIVQKAFCFRRRFDAIRFVGGVVSNLAKRS